MGVQYGGNIMSFMDDFYKRFVKEEYDENGIVTKFDLELVIRTQKLGVEV